MMNDNADANKDDSTNNDIKFLKHFQESMATKIREANKKNNKHVDEKMMSIEKQILDIKDADKVRDEESNNRFKRMERRLDLPEEEKKREKHRIINQNKLRQIEQDLVFQPAGRTQMHDSLEKQMNDIEITDVDPLLIEEPVYRSSFTSTLGRESNLGKDLADTNAALANLSRGEKGKEVFTEIAKKVNEVAASLANLNREKEKETFTEKAKRAKSDKLEKEERIAEKKKKKKEERGAMKSLRRWFDDETDMYVSDSDLDTDVWSTMDRAVRNKQKRKEQQKKRTEADNHEGEASAGNKSYYK